MFTRITHPLVPLALVLLLPGAFLAAPASPRRDGQAPMQQQAARAAGRPMKLDVRPATRSARVGDRVLVKVVLLGAGNQAASWARPCLVIAEVTGPSGKRQQYKVEIPPGQTEGDFTLQASQAGIFKLTVRDTENTLMPGGNAVLVSAAPAAKKTTRARRRSASYAPGTTVRLLAVGARLGSSLSVLAFTQSPDQPQPAAPGLGPQLMATNSSGKDEILADGKDFARIQLYYVDPQGTPAPADIKVWMHWLHGKFDPQPLVIHKGDSSAEGHWTSLSPASDTLSVAASAPNIPVAGDRNLPVTFVPPIYGITPAAASPLKLSLIDAEPLTAQFFDQQGRPIQTSKARNVTFVSSSPALAADPASIDVPAGAPGATIYLLPSWSGTSRLDIWTPGYDHQTLVVQVTMSLVLLLCVSGGIIGGIAARDKLKGSVLWRIFVGLVGAIVLVWLGVYAVLPRTHSIIAHNLVSVFVVGIIGGYAGTQVLDFAAKKLGWL